MIRSLPTQVSGELGAAQYITTLFSMGRRDKSDYVSSVERSNVSVVIPTRNRASYLPLAVESVLNQTPPPLEVIVVDDDSTDDTAAVVERYGDQIVYRKIRNGGRPAVPRNVGIELAKGELVAFQDSDDEWAPGKLERQLSFMADESVVLSYGNAMAESVIATIKRELTKRYSWKTRLDLELALVVYIGFYNQRRLYRSIDGRQTLELLDEYRQQRQEARVISK